MASVFFEIASSCFWSTRSLLFSIAPSSSNRLDCSASIISFSSNRFLFAAIYADCFESKLSFSFKRFSFSETLSARFSIFEAWASCFISTSNWFFAKASACCTIYVACSSESELNLIKSPSRVLKPLTIKADICFDIACAKLNDKQVKRILSCNNSFISATASFVAITALAVASAFLFVLPNKPLFMFAASSAASLASVIFWVESSIFSNINLDFSSAKASNCEEDIFSSFDVLICNSLLVLDIYLLLFII